MKAISKLQLQEKVLLVAGTLLTLGFTLMVNFYGFSEF